MSPGIDRVGQLYPAIQIVNLYYEDTFEPDIYMALRGRIKPFETFVGGRRIAERYDSPKPHHSAPPSRASRGVFSY